MHCCRLVFQQIVFVFKFDVKCMYFETNLFFFLIMCFSVEMKCTACGESTDKWHDASLSETVEDRTGHANVHYSAKCKLCARENNLSKFNCIVTKKKGILTIELNHYVPKRVII
jgi:hypothetical protein